ncbi:D-beta-hydroxybutyrate dehydrogenase [Halomonas citrativorans]|uniref:D-beta-hydroxybutyrate dehydrogenase n=1 Tax=Halomonas citrativorans TaxID=2742612 RepID=A0A1R4HSQ0_9GAMM|nr:NAD(P)-dependent oxidoreductase [Halomonas citrativorans]MBE0405081.1 NAD(P)-dependent oxidoreductase [Halomonas citrativorans]SJN10601.1 D-beta-hydroxybutyrate dehydrogenase [Halomonas citrativorans]
MHNIAFAGLGAMGRPMATCLKNAGFNVLGIDAFEQVETTFNDQATSSDAKHRYLADCNALFIMVVNAEQVRAVLFGNNAGDGTTSSVVSSLKEGACIVQMSTIAPSDAAGIASEVAAVRPGLHYIDAPVSGGVVGAQAGELTIMAAGSEEALGRCSKAFEVMGKAVFVAGPTAGQGAAMKAVNQLLCGVHIAAAAEALSLAEKSGIESSVMLSMVQGSAASSWMLGDRGPRMIAEPGEVTSVVDIFCKDMGIVCDSAKVAKAFTPLAETARQMFVASSERGEGKLDDSQVIRTYRLLNGKG